MFLGEECIEMRDDLDRILATMGGHGEVVNFLLSLQLLMTLVAVLLSAGCRDTNLKSARTWDGFLDIMMKDWGRNA